jgi:hypothetical protein
LHRLRYEEIQQEAATHFQKEARATKTVGNCKSLGGGINSGALLAVRESGSWIFQNSLNL